MDSEFVSVQPLPQGVEAQADEGAVCMDLAGLRSSPKDVAMYHRAIVVHSLLTFGAMVLCHLGLVPIWGLVLANLIFYPEIYLRIHDVGHGAAVQRFGVWARFVPVSNPIWGGTRVFSLVHREHHKNLGTDHDPWLPYYTGSPARALFFNFIEPEYSYAQYVRLFGMDRELVLNTLYNLMFLTGNLALFQSTFLCHLLIQRCVHAVGIFFFNFYTHRETLSANARIGTWEREPELRRVLPALRFLWGWDVIDGLIYHNRHHCLGQQHVPVQNYKHLTDTREYTRHHDSWPIDAIKKLS